MEKVKVFKIIAIVGLIMFLMSCTSQKYARKCNGKKGVKTNMGIL